MRWFVIRALFQHDDLELDSARLDTSVTWLALARLASSGSASASVAAPKSSLLTSIRPRDALEPARVVSVEKWKGSRNIIPDSVRITRTISISQQAECVASLRCIAGARGSSSCPLRPMNLARTCCQPSSQPSNSKSNNSSIPLQRTAHATRTPARNCCLDRLPISAVS